MLIVGSSVHAFITGLGLAICLIGAIVLLTGIAIASVARRARQRGVMANGMVVGYNASPLRRWVRRMDDATPGRSTVPALNLNYPIVEFATPAGERIRATARNSSTPRPGRIGAPITVYFNPADPQRCWAETGKSANATRLLQGAVIVVGVLILIGGLEILRAA